MEEADRALSQEAVNAYFDAYFRLKSRYFRVVIALFISAVPEGVLYDYYLKPWVVPNGLLCNVAVQVPWVVYFAVTFIRVPPPIMPRAFRCIMLFIMYWYAMSIAVLALLAMVTPRPIAFHVPYEEAVLWVTALSGSLAVPILLRCSRDLAAVRVA